MRFDSRAMKGSYHSARIPGDMANHIYLPENHFAMMIGVGKCVMDGLLLNVLGSEI